jgi:hypothetical protein
MLEYLQVDERSQLQDFVPVVKGLSKVEGIEAFEAQARQEVREALARAKGEHRTTAHLEAEVLWLRACLSLANQLAQATTDAAKTRQVSVVNEKIVQRDGNGDITRILEVVGT